MSRSSPAKQISAIFKGPNGPNLDLTVLPPEYEIHLLDEAREFYTSETPLFIIDNQNKQRLDSKVCLASKGYNGAPGDKISVTLRSWCCRSKFQTIDVNKQRIIIKFFTGGPWGGFYRRWMGILAGFEKQPIAFPARQVSGTRESNKMGRVFLPGVITGDAESTTVRKRKSMPSKVDESDPSEAEFVPPRKKPAHASSPRLIELEKSPNAATRNRNPQIDQPLDLAPAATMNPPESNPASTRASVAPSTAALPYERGQAPSPSVPPADTSSMQSGNKSSLPPATPSSPKAAATSAPPPNPIDELASNPPSPPLLATATTTTATTLSQAEVASSSLAHILSPQKQASTILLVYLNREEDYVPIYLRSCMTISHFFDSCLGAFELADQAETVSALRVRLDPNNTTTTAGSAANNVWLVKRAVPDSFAIFLEAVKYWAGWMERDICNVRVDIILKAKK